VSWKRSVHASGDAGCFDCHADPGFIGGLKAKVNGIKYLYYSYAGHRDVQVLHAEVSNESCSQCHDIKTMDENMDKRINPVQHTGDTHNPHVNELNISCTSCHENIMHITLLGESKKAWYSCKNCHKQTGFINLE
jgi:nitrate/TMAO reductase-like tetraheme cytochrome c subunit